MYSISAIVPVFNEKIVLKESIDIINKFLLKNFSDYEILVIESGSTDGSGEICDELAEKYEFVTVIHESQRNGFGSALKIGYQNAIKDLIWLITLDLPFPLESILNAIPKLSNYNCVLSYRCNDNRNWKRKLQSIAYNKIIKLSLGLKVKHVNSVFKVFKRDIIQNMNITSDGWFIDAEIIYWLQQKNISFVELPVELIDRKEGQSKITLLSILTILKELFSFKILVK